MNCSYFRTLLQRSKHSFTTISADFARLMRVHDSSSQIATSSVDDAKQRKKLLIVYHTHGVKVAQMSEAVERGAHDAVAMMEMQGRVAIVRKRCAEADHTDFVDADAILFGSPENFGYMSGMMKDLLERIYYPLQNKIEGRHYAVFVGSGSDGTGCVTSIDRIVTGLRLRRLAEPVIALGPLVPSYVKQCEELGATAAARICL
jgi:multimeric flavodoxin WrbA